MKHKRTPYIMSKYHKLSEIILNKHKLKFIPYMNMVAHCHLFDINCEYYHECELRKKYTIEDLSKIKMGQTGFRMKCCSTGAVIHVKDGKMIDRKW